MKILLRRYDGQPYVWKTAKYDGKYFRVDGMEMYEENIISVMNDNRKNYIRCSSCEKIFPRNGKQFLKHQKASCGVGPCMTCRKLRIDNISEAKVKYVVGEDGSYTRKTEQKVELRCHMSFYTDFPIESEDAVMYCNLRQCGDAHGVDIVDVFTKYPGLFDDIITIDTILDKGYSRMVYCDKNGTEYLIDANLGVHAYVNKLGIVECFWIENEWMRTNELYYSKKYDALYTAVDNKYEPYDADAEVRKCIEKFYK